MAEGTKEVSWLSDTVARPCSTAMSTTTQPEQQGAPGLGALLPIGRQPA
jgi:hypothetical protein